jgi:hypothetical protein
MRCFLKGKQLFFKPYLSLVLTSSAFLPPSTEMGMEEVISEGLVSDEDDMRKYELLKLP